MVSSPTVATNSGRLAISVALAASLSLAGGCNNAGQGAFSGAAIGTLGGLAIGSLSGAAGEGAIIGLVSGAIAGGVIGDQNARRGSYAPGSYEHSHQGNDRLPKATWPNYYDPRYDDKNGYPPHEPHEGSPDPDDYFPNYDQSQPEPMDEYGSLYSDEFETEDENTISFYSGPTLYDYDGIVDLNAYSYSDDSYDDYGIATYASYSPRWSITIGLSGYYGWCSTCSCWHHNRYSYTCGYKPRYYGYYGGSYAYYHRGCYDRHYSWYWWPRYSYRYSYRYGYSWCAWRPYYSWHIGYYNDDWWWHYGSGYGFSIGYYSGGHKHSYDHDYHYDYDRYDDYGRRYDQRRRNRSGRYDMIGLRDEYKGDPNALRRDRRAQRAGGDDADRRGRRPASEDRRGGRTFATNSRPDVGQEFERRGQDELDLDERNRRPAERGRRTIFTAEDRDMPTSQRARRGANEDREAFERRARDSRRAQAERRAQQADERRTRTVRPSDRSRRTPTAQSQRRSDASARNRGSERSRRPQAAPSRSGGERPSSRSRSNGSRPAAAPRSGGNRSSGASRSGGNRSSGASRGGGSNRSSGASRGGGSSRSSGASRGGGSRRGGSGRKN